MSAPMPGYPVTTAYGTPGAWAAGYHTGDDYSTRGGTGVPVLASRRGLVISTGNAWGSAYGVHVVVQGPRGRIRTGYCHLSRVTCSPGDKIKRGQVIGYSGNTGRSTGPHLHYEERRSPFAYADHRRPRFNRRGRQ